MDDAQVIAALAALAQPTRLNTFRLLVAHEPEGIPAGELARLAEVPQNTMSAHLAVLARAGLITGERQSRSIIYRADLQQFRDVTLFLLKDCCGGKPEICASLIADLTPCCPPPKPNQPEVMWRSPPAAEYLPNGQAAVVKRRRRSVAPGSRWRLGRQYPSAPSLERYETLPPQHGSGAGYAL